MPANRAAVLRAMGRSGARVAAQLAAELTHRAGVARAQAQALAISSGQVWPASLDDVGW